MKTKKPQNTGPEKWWANTPQEDKVWAGNLLRNLSDPRIQIIIHLAEIAGQQLEFDEASQRAKAALEKEKEKEE